MTRVLVTGSRHWPDKAKVHAVLEALEAEFGIRYTVVHGACPTGVDKIADDWAIEHGHPREPHPARWESEHGRGAGFIRNSEMAQSGPDVCVAFIADCIKEGCTKTPYPHGSHGAAHCSKAARRAGVRVRTYTERQPT